MLGPTPPAVVRHGDDYLKFFTPGNKVTPLYDQSVTPDDPADEIFFNVREGLCRAKSSIQLEMFGFGQPVLADLLEKRAREGVKVQCVLDPVTPGDSYETDKDRLSKEMIANGVDVKWYPVKDKTEAHHYPQIDHVKMLVLDGHEAIIGGMNWDAHSPFNHDVDVRVEGPAVDRMSRLFARDYLKSGGKAEDLPHFEPTPAPPGGDALVSLATASENPADRSIRATLFRNIDNAKLSVDAELFCLTDHQLCGALVDAHKRGVNVRTILNPLEIGKSKVNEKAVKQLRAGGVDVRWFVPDEATRNKLHAKIAVFDHHETVLGSANWSANGTTWNHEADVDVIDPTVATSYTRMFNDDWQRGSAEPQYLTDADD